jgi:hypothetical protein
LVRAIRGAFPGAKEAIMGVAVVIVAVAAREAGGCC